MSSLTLVHVLLSLLAIAAGAVVLYVMIGPRIVSRWTQLFLITTAVTCLTGYALPADKLLPSHIVGLLTLLTLVVAGYALYVRKLVGKWRPTYVAAAVTALYLNVFVGVVQAFLKIPPLHVLAPTQTELPFIVVQVIVLLLFIVWGVMAAKRLLKGD
ncbi:MAG: hypothetical protein K0Q78_178 [Cellvibrio sp.]|nr:hypothetical protein [Cellvibrio sp.]